jgi:hypothetical protein
VTSGMGVSAQTCCGWGGGRLLWLAGLRGPWPVAALHGLGAAWSGADELVVVVDGSSFGGGVGGWR